MTTLVVGASGATGQLLVDQLLCRGQSVKAIVRSPDKLPASFQASDRLSVIQASILELSDAELIQHVSGCEAVVSCLGHTMDLKGIYGQPRKLVTDAVRRLCHAIEMGRPQLPVKLVLMNTAGNRDLSEPISLPQKVALWLIRNLVPPHADNEQAVDYLRTKVGQSHEIIEWAAVRPDGLIDQVAVSEYAIYLSPIRSAIFDAGTTSRINVGHFMAELITCNETWAQWKGKMPVIYNRSV